jgi:hypothetical protein
MGGEGADWDRESGITDPKGSLGDREP